MINKFCIIIVLRLNCTKVSFVILFKIQIRLYFSMDYATFSSYLALQEIKVLYFAYHCYFKTKMVGYIVQ
jgi:hypothetical protein